MIGAETWWRATALAGLTFGLVVPVRAQSVVELPAPERSLTGDPVEVFRIGAFDGEVWETFGEVAGTAFDASGNLYVLDRQASRITVVDREGNFVREIGGPGEGPGEFRLPTEFTVMRDGRVVVADLGHRSYQIFGADGVFLRMVSMGDDDVIRVGAMAPDPRGGAIISAGGGIVVAMRSGPDGASAEPSTRPVERISLDGETASVTTLAEAWRAPRPHGGERLEGGGMSFSLSAAGPRVFEPDLLVGVLPEGGVVYADSSTYTIKVIRPDGSVARLLHRPDRPRAVTPRMEGAERERRLAELEEDGGPRVRMMTRGPGGGSAQAIPQEALDEMIRGQVESMQFYPELPVIMDLKASWTGKIWVQRRGEEPTQAGSIDVITSDGRYAGTFPADRALMPSSFGPDGLAAYLATDEFDVPVVIVRRLPTILN